MATLPQQAPGPGPTDQALPSYLSYSQVATNVITYTSTITQVVYDPQGGFAPFQTLGTIQGVTTSVTYSVVNVPLLYTGPFPAPDLGTLYTTPGQALPSATPTATESNGVAPTATATAGESNGGSADGGGATQTAAPTPATTPAAPTDTAATAGGTAAGTQDGSVTAESAPSTAPTATATSPPTTDTANPTAAPTTSPTSTVPTGSSNITTNPASSLPTSSATRSNASTNNPSATVAGAPNSPNNSQNLASNGLSGGQIAGIVLGSFFALLLLLLLLLCCLRRRRKHKQQAAVLSAAAGGTGPAFAANNRGNNARGNYAAIGTGAAAGTADARRPSLSGSDDWEEDHLTGGGSGSGFFVVGGRRLGPDRRASIASRRSQRNFTAGNVASSTPTSSGQEGGFAGLAATGAGFFAAALGRNKNKSRVEIEEEQQPLSDNEVGNGSMAERRGLMNPHDSPGGRSGYGSGQKMRETGRAEVVGPAAALLAASGGAAAYGASRDGRGSRSGLKALSSSAATNSSHTQKARQGVSSSNSTGGFTSSGGSGTNTSLPPPPRAPRSSPQQPLTTYNNFDAGSAETTNPRFSATTMGSTSTGTGVGGGVNPALMGLGAGAALGGLGALAAGHRESEGSSYSRHPGAQDIRASHVSEMSADELRHLRSTDPERYSRFISSGSNLLGPDYQPLPDPEADAKELDDANAAVGTMSAGGSTFQRTRLPTIRSVGEFGEKSDSPGTTRYNQSSGNRTTHSSSMHAFSVNSGSIGAASAGSRGNVVSPLPQYEAQQLQAGEALPHYTYHDQPRATAEEEQIQSPISEGAGRFVTLPASPRNTLGGVDRSSFDDPTKRYDAPEGQDRGAELEEGGVASAGILGGVAAGWRRLTMGQYAWIPDTSCPSRNAEHQQSGFYRDSSGELGTDPEGRISHDQQPSEDSSRLIHHNRRASRLETSETGLAPSVRSERASVYGPSALEHATNTSRSSPVAHLSSKEGSGSSGEQRQQQRQRGSGESGAAAAAAVGARSHPSLSSQNSPSTAGGYAASQSNSSLSGRRTIASESSGLDSLSAVAQLSSRSTGSASTRSGYRSSSRSRGSSRGGRGRRSGGLSSEASIGSGASTGAASYSPSGVLSRGNTTSTRGLGAGEESGPAGSAVYFPPGATGEYDVGEEEEEGDEDEVDVASGIATEGAGSGSYERRGKRPRSSSGDGLSRLDSLLETSEDPFADVEAMPTVPPPAGGHYPSSSLGAAVSRTAARDAAESNPSYLQSNPLPQRSRICSLQPGTSAPVPTALAPSLSTPSLNSSSNSNPNLPTEPAPQETMHSRGSGSLSSIPASASWRPSPRVASAVQRAAEAQAALLAQQQQGGPTPPRSQTASPSGAGALYNWADLDTTFRSEPGSNGRRQPSADLEGARAEGEEDKANKSFEWPKFLRF
ncbi:uncharacterized protein UDID_01490 [Ustilago sp. UG-2017a]|nr:uncharacterized protein UDID_01490 [Ustilago sp. UG-2017a]